MSRSLPADPIPEPLPVDQLPTGCLELGRRGDVLVVRPLGAIDRASLPRIRHAVLGARRPVILDLDSCVLVDAASLVAEDLDPGMRGVPDLRIACGRLSCRRLLSRAGAAERYGIYESVDDALHAGEAAVRTGVDVTTATDGHAAATIDVHGHLCAATAPVLHAEVARLISDGVSVISVRLGSVDRCGIHGATRPGFGEGDRDRSADSGSDVAAHVLGRVFDVLASGDPGRALEIGVK